MCNQIRTIDIDNQMTRAEFIYFVFHLIFIFIFIFSLFFTTKANKQIEVRIVIHSIVNSFCFCSYRLFVDELPIAWLVLIESTACPPFRTNPWSMPQLRGHRGILGGIASRFFICFACRFLCKHNIFSVFSSSLFIIAQYKQMAHSAELAIAVWKLRTADYYSNLPRIINRNRQ